MHSAKSTGSRRPLSLTSAICAAIVLAVRRCRPATAARAMRFTQSKALVANGPGGSPAAPVRWRAATRPVICSPHAPAPAPAIELGRRRPADGVVDDDRPAARSPGTRPVASPSSVSMRDAVLGVADARRRRRRRCSLIAVGLVERGCLVVGGERRPRSSTVSPREPQGGDRRRGERPAVGVVEVGDGRRPGAGALGVAGRSPPPAASRSARCGRTARSRGSRRGRAPSPSASTSGRRPTSRSASVARAIVDDAGPMTASTSRSIRPAIGSRAVAALLPSSNSVDELDRLPEHAAGGVDRVGGDAGGVDQRLADRRPLPGLGSRSARSAARRRRPCGAVVVVDGRSTGSLVRRGRAAVVVHRVRRARATPTASEHEADRVARSHRRRCGHFTTIGAAADPVPFTDGSDGRRDGRDEVIADRSLGGRAAVPGAVGRHRRGARRTVRTTPSSRIVGPAPPGGGRPRRRRRVRPPGARAAQRRRRRCCVHDGKPRRPRRARHRALVPAVGRRAQARPRRALARRPAGARRRRPRHGHRAAQRPHPRRRRRARPPGWRPRAWRAGAATAAAGSTPCARRSSSAGPRPATSPTCSSRI